MRQIQGKGPGRQQVRPGAVYIGLYLVFILQGLFQSFVGLLLPGLGLGQCPGDQERGLLKFPGTAFLFLFGPKVQGRNGVKILQPGFQG